MDDLVILILALLKLKLQGLASNSPASTSTPDSSPKRKRTRQVNSASSSQPSSPHPPASAKRRRQHRFEFMILSYLQRLSEHLLILQKQCSKEIIIILKSEQYYWQVIFTVVQSTVKCVSKKLQLEPPYGTPYGTPGWISHKSLHLRTKISLKFNSLMKNKHCDESVFNLTFYEVFFLQLLAFQYSKLQNSAIMNNLIRIKEPCCAFLYYANANQTIHKYSIHTLQHNNYCSKKLHLRCKNKKHYYFLKTQVCSQACMLLKGAIIHAVLKFMVQCIPVCTIGITLK